MRAARPTVECATLAVQLPVPPTQHTCCALLHALLKHLLYARGHIPCLYDTMLDIALAEQQAAAGGLEECQQQSLLRPRVRQSRPKRVDKRRLQFLRRAEALLDSIGPHLFSTCQPTRCFILLGASTTRPREAYEVVLPVALPSDDELSAAEMGRDDHTCRVLLRQLITAAPDLPEGTAAQRPGKVYLLIQAPAGAVPPPGFAVKRAFKLAMRKGVHVAFSLGGAELQRQQEQQQQLGVMAATPASACAAARGSGSGEAAERAAVWLQSKWVLRGMKVSSGSSAMC